MQYLCLIYSDESIQQAMSESERAEYIGAYGTFTQSIKKTGAMVGGEALLPVASAVTVRVRNGQVVTTDGPFAETKEQLGGYYLVEAPDIEAACAIAARIPTATHGCVEVRSLMIWG
ncbi:MAG: hypothetical protein ACI8PZ_000617 [Myxococcota bacterium]|jgi:hypothetical protein